MKPPHTFLAKVVNYIPAAPDYLVIWLWAQTPNRFHGTDRQLDDLIRDFACIEGVGWVPWTERRMKDNDEQGNKGVPYPIDNAKVRDPTRGEALKILGDLFEDYCDLSLGAAEKYSPRKVQAGLDPLLNSLVHIATTKIRGYSLAPEGLPDDVADLPSYVWAFRIVELRLHPGTETEERGAYPDEVLIDWKRRWWPTWA